MLRPRLLAALVALAVRSKLMACKKGRPAWALLLLLVVVPGHAACGSTERHGGDSPVAGDDGGGSGGVGGSSPGGTPGRAGSSPVGGSASEAGAGPMTMLPPGLSDMPSTTQCGVDACESAQVGPVYVDPCCDASGACGLTTSFLALVGAKFEDVCQAHDQPGAPSDSCGSASGLKVPFQMGGATIMVSLDPFAGCCRPDGTCGVVVNQVTTAGGLLPLADLGLGCVDAAPFAGGQVTECGADPGAGGAAGAGGADAAGAPSVPAGGVGGAE